MREQLCALKELHEEVRSAEPTHLHPFLPFLPRVPLPPPHNHHHNHPATLFLLLRLVVGARRGYWRTQSISGSRKFWSRSCLDSRHPHCDSLTRLLTEGETETETETERAALTTADRLVLIPLLLGKRSSVEMLWASGKSRCRSALCQAAATATATATQVARVVITDENRGGALWIGRQTRQAAGHDPAAHPGRQRARHTATIP